VIDHFTFIPVHIDITIPEVDARHVLLFTLIWRNGLKLFVTYYSLPEVEPAGGIEHSIY